MKSNVAIRAGLAAIVAASVTAYSVMPILAAPVAYLNSTSKAVSYPGDTPRVLQTWALNKSGKFQEALVESQKIAEDPLATMEERCTALERIALNSMLLGKRDAALAALSQFDQNRQGFGPRSATMNKQLNGDPGIETKTAGLEIDPKIELRTADLNIDPAIVAEAARIRTALTTPQSRQTVK